MSNLETGLYYPINLDGLPASWEKDYVGDFALEIQPGFASGKHNKEGRGIPHIRPYNIDRLGKLDLTEIKSVAPDADIKRLHSGDVLFNNTNSPELIGKTTVVLAPGDWGFSNHMTRVVFPDTVSPKFAACQLHYLWLRGYFLHNCVKHVNQASVSSKTLARAVPFVRPSRRQQDCIVAEIEKQFSRLDEAVVSLKHVKANLKRYKAAVLKAAVEGKLTEDWRKLHPNVEPASMLLERILVERRAKWNGKGKYKEPFGPNSADLPSLPKGWTWATVEQLASGLPGSIQSGPFGSHLLHSEFVDEGVLAIGIDNIVDGKFSLGSQHRITPQKFEVLRRFEARPRDVVITVMATVGRVCVLPQNLERAIITKHCYRITPVRDAVDSDYFSIALSAESSTRQHIFGNVRGQTRPGINGPILKAAPVALPPPREQQQIVAEIERRLSVIEELQAAIQANLTRADHLRQAILFQAFSGELLGSRAVSSLDRAESNHAGSSSI